MGSVTSVEVVEDVVASTGSVVVDDVVSRRVVRGCSSSTTVRRSAGGRKPPRSCSLTLSSSKSDSQAPSTRIESSPRPAKESRFIYLTVLMGRSRCDNRKGSPDGSVGPLGIRNGLLERCPSRWAGAVHPNVTIPTLPLYAGRSTFIADLHPVRLGPSWARRMWRSRTR